MAKKITEAKLEQVRKAVAKAFYAEELGGDQPIAIMDWDYGPAIVWEGAPVYDWPQIFVQIEAGFEAQDYEFGLKFAPIKKIAGVFIEPATHYAVSVYAE